MELMIESTNTVTTVNGVPCRLWEGITPRGTPCKVFVHMIACRESDETEFAKELEELKAPTEVKDLLGLLK